MKRAAPVQEGVLPPLRRGAMQRSRLYPASSALLSLERVIWSSCSQGISRGRGARATLAAGSTRCGRAGFLVQGETSASAKRGGKKCKRRTEKRINRTGRFDTV